MFDEFFIAIYKRIPFSWTSQNSKNGLPVLHNENWPRKALFVAQINAALSNYASLAAPNKARLPRFEQSKANLWCLPITWHRSTLVNWARHRKVVFFN